MLSRYIGITLRGLLMGAADVVPGVSGGTIAFITGIYEELINSFNNLNLSALKTLKNEGFSSFWKKVNGSFLLALFIGIFISLISLANLITLALAQYPIPTWSFFFGLIVASVLYIGKQIGTWRWQEIASLIIGTIIAYLITISPAMESQGELWYIFLSGMIAICAMILPGISGSFILLLMGSYTTILGAISGLTEDFKRHVLTLGIFAAGCVVGLLTFSRVVSWAFLKARSITMAVLTGFMLGSLNKVWPWKKIIQRRVNSHGEIVPFLEKSVSPDVFAADRGLPPEITAAIIFSVVGFALVFALGLFDNKKDSLESR